MKKEHLFLSMLVLIVFISGCQGSSGFSSAGPNGVQIKFIQPKDTIVNEGSSVPIEIEITNHAECNVLGTLCVRDTLSDSFGGLNEQCKGINLGEARTNNKNIEIDLDKFFPVSQPYTNLFVDQSTDIIANAKYSCDIVTGPSGVCTKSPFNTDNPQCPTSEIISGNNLGSKAAPVTVTRIDKSISGSQNDLKLNLDIELRKMDKGRISSNEESQDSNLKGYPIKIEVDHAGNQMNCKGQDYKDGILYWKATNTNPERIINCEILLNSGIYQKDPVNIHLNYVYEISESKTINIKNTET